MRDTVRAKQAVEHAKTHRGDPYGVGGIGPNVWDCRGLADDALHAVGELKARFGRLLWPLSPELYDTYAKHAVTVGTALTLEGTLLFWEQGDGSIFHVAFSLGDETVIHSAGTPGLGGEPEVLIARYDAYRRKPTRAVDPFA